MSITSIVALAAVLPLIGALICRLDDASGASRISWPAFVELLLICGAGWVLIESIMDSLGLEAWLLLVAGWGWVAYTWLASIAQRATSAAGLGRTE